jgi:hypothetical protein
MAFRKPQPKKTRGCPVALAVAAVEDSGRPLDLAVRDLDNSPTALGLDNAEERDVRSDPRRPAGVCPKCGFRLGEGRTEA